MNARAGTKTRRRNVTGLLLLAVPSVLAAGLLVLAVPYYAGASARIASLYSKLAVPADRTLTPVLADYSRNQHHNLAAAKLDLSKEARTEVSFDNQLGQITFPAGVNPHPALLIAADQKQIRLLRLQMRAKTLRKLRSFDSRIQSADAAIEAQARIIRKDLGLPSDSTPLY